MSDRFNSGSLRKDDVKNLYHMFTTIAGHGTLPFLGPEFYAARDGQGLTDGKMVFDSAVDIFAMGIVFAYMFCYSTNDYGL